MSKKCCGIIYNQDEKFCTLCGKKLEDTPDAEGANSFEKVEDNTEDNVEAVESQNKVDELPIMGVDEIDKLTADLMKDMKDLKNNFEATDKVVSGAVDEPVEEAVNEPEQLSADAEEDGADKKADNQQQTKQTKSEALAEDEDEEEDDNEASAGLKFIGFLSLLVMFAAIATLVLALIFIMLKPFYKDYDSSKQVVYPEIGTDTDADQNIRPALTYITFEEATATDVNTEATATDASQSDTTLDADVTEE